MFYTLLDKNDNPFLDQIQDVELLKRTFTDRPFIPYNGTNQEPQHTLLYVLDVLSKMSPTQSAILNSMAFYCYGGKVGLVNSIDTEFALEQNDITGPSANKHFDNLMLVKPSIGYRELAKLLFRSRKFCGEHYVQINYHQIAGVRRTSIKYIDPLNIMPVITEEGEQETFIVFEQWCSDTLDRKKYEIIGKYPFITESNYEGHPTGFYSTIVQYKNGIGKRGRPCETGIMIDQFREYKDNIFLTRQSANNFVPQIFIEQEEAETQQTFDDELAAREANFDNALERMIYNTTNSGDPQPILMSNRPFGTSQAYIHEFQQNTNEKWFNMTGGITKKRIIEAHGWSDKLIGDSDVGTGLNSSAILETLKIKLPLIDAQASIEEKTINTVIDSALNWMGIDFSGIDIKFNNPYKTMLEQTNGNNQTNANQVQQNPTSQNPIK